MRADAQKNHDHLLVVAHDVVVEQGAEASLRDVARRARVGLGTLYRHFPTREALLDELLRTSFDDLAGRARELENSSTPEEALSAWLRQCVACAHEYRGVTSLMMAAIEDPKSASACFVRRDARRRHEAPNPRPARRCRTHGYRRH